MGVEAVTAPGIADRLQHGAGEAATAALWQPAEHAFPVERLDEFLLWAADMGASDVSFQTGQPAMVDVDGRLRRATPAELDSTAMEMLVERLFNATGDGILRSGKAIDCSVAVREGRLKSRRFRANMSPVQVDHGFGVNVVLRVLPERVPEFGELGTEPGIVEAWEACRGLTLVTGVPGSGKSTLMAAGTRRLLENGVGRIQSFEAPIEYVFDGIGGDGALMSSAEVPRHFGSFAEGLRSSLRRRPTAVIVGEARDRETVEAVVRAADYGIAVYATAHTTGVAAAVRRLVSEFPETERRDRGCVLVDVLNLVVTQVLLINPNGGLTALREWLAFDDALKRELLESALPDWARIVEAAVAWTGVTLASEAVRAASEGRISVRDLARLFPGSRGELARAVKGTELEGRLGADDGWAAP